MDLLCAALPGADPGTREVPKRIRLRICQTLCLVAVGQPWWDNPLEGPLQLLTAGAWHVPKDF